MREDHLSQRNKWGGRSLLEGAAVVPSPDLLGSTDHKVPAHRAANSTHSPAVPRLVPVRQSYSWRELQTPSLHQHICTQLEHHLTEKYLI